TIGRQASHTRTCLMQSDARTRGKLQRSPRMTQTCGSGAAAPRGSRPQPPGHATQMRLEVFPGVAIHGILGSTYWGARLRWAAGARLEPTATEGGDPMAHSHAGPVATPCALAGDCGARR